MQPLSGRAAALLVLSRVLDGATLDTAWAELPRDPPIPERDKAFARRLVLVTLRRMGQIDDVIRRCLDQPLQRRRGNIRDILRVGACQLLFLDTPSHAAVDATVLLAEGSPLKGLVNAVLRRLAREGKAMLSPREAPRLNMPDWLWRQLRDAWNEETARAISNVHMGEPPLDLTVKSDGAGWAAKLGGHLLPTGSVRLRNVSSVVDLPGYADGEWWVQDTSAALPARLLTGILAPGSRVADLCAAPGGKTAQLAAAGLHVTAVDVSPERLVRLRTNLTRLKLTAEVVANYAETWRPEALLDGVLVDAPCTATGTIRRNPEIPWIKDATAAAGLRATQDTLLEHAGTLVREGGVIAYAVCSLDQSEGEHRVAAFLGRHPEFERVPVTEADVGGLAEVVSPAGDLRALPNHLGHIGGMDGFYAARLRRIAAPATGILAAPSPS